MNGLGVFRKNYVVRRFGEQQFIKGYASVPYTDVMTSLNVQPLSPNELQALPEGDRAVRRLKAFGSLPLTAADQETGTPGDWLFYSGRWYRCVSAIPWDHTMLSHCKSEFCAVPETEPPQNLAPPKEVEW